MAVSPVKDSRSKTKEDHQYRALRNSKFQAIQNGAGVGRPFLGRFQSKTPCPVKLAGTTLLSSKSRIVFLFQPRDKSIRLSRLKFSWGLCVPEVCTANDIQTSLDTTLAEAFREHNISFRVELTSVMCYSGKEMEERHMPLIGKLWVWVSWRRNHSIDISRCFKRGDAFQKMLRGNVTGILLLLNLREHGEFLHTQDALSCSFWKKGKRKKPSVYRTLKP